MPTKKKPRRISLGYKKGSVEELPSGSWRWQGTIDGERVSITRSSETAARDAARIALYNGAKPTGMTVAELMIDWSESRKVPGARRKTLSNDATSVAAIIAAMGDVAVSELDGPGGVKLVEDRLLKPIAARGLGRASLDKQRSALNMACQRAKRRGDMEFNPVPFAEAPKVTKRKRTTPHYRPDEIPIVIDFLVTNHRAKHALFLTMLLCGLRCEEARGLLWENVHLKEGVLDVETCAEVDGTIHDVLKTDNHNRAAHRRIPIPPELGKVLEAERTEQLARCGRRPHVFADDKGNVFRDAMLDPAAESISRGADVRFIPPGGYRHTYASMLMDSRVLSAKEIMQLCGWTTLAMLSNYTHSMVAVPDAVAAINRSIEQRVHAG